MDNRQIYRTSKAAQESQTILLSGLIGLIPFLLKMFQGKRKPDETLKSEENK
jgi:hypothetical protein